MHSMQLVPPSKKASISIVNDIEEREQKEEHEEGKKTGAVDALRLLRDPGEEDIEKQLVDELKRRHEAHAAARRKLAS